MGSLAMMLWSSFPGWSILRSSAVGSSILVSVAEWLGLIPWYRSLLPRQRSQLTIPTTRTPRLFALLLDHPGGLIDAGSSAHSWRGWSRVWSWSSIAHGKTRAVREMMTAAERRPLYPIRPKIPIPTRTATETSVRWRVIRWPIRSTRPRVRHGPSVLKVTIDTR